MAKVMKWPPVPVGGRIPMVKGIDATTILVLLTLGDTSQNPYNPRSLSLGEVAFKTDQAAEGRIRATLQRLSSIIYIDEFKDSSSKDDIADGIRTYSLKFTDREARQQTEIEFNG